MKNEAKTNKRTHEKKWPHSTKRMWRCWVIIINQSCKSSRCWNSITYSSVFVQKATVQYQLNPWLQWSFGQATIVSFFCFASDCIVPYHSHDVYARLACAIGNYAHITLILSDFFCEPHAASPNCLHTKASTGCSTWPVSVQSQPYLYIFVSICISSFGLLVVVLGFYKPLRS